MTTKRKTASAGTGQPPEKAPALPSIAEQLRALKADKGRRIDDGPTPRQTAFMEIFGRDPASLRKAADLLGSDPQFEELSEELRAAAFDFLMTPFTSPRSPKGGKAGRRRDSLYEGVRKREEEAKLRADLSALASAIKGGRVPRFLYVPHLSRHRMLGMNLPAVVSWARSARAEEKEARLERMPGDHVTAARLWAVKAYLRATGAEDSPESVKALLKRWEAAPSQLESRPLPKRPK